MRIRFISICLAVLVLLLCACGSETANENSKNEQSQLSGNLSQSDSSGSSGVEESKGEEEWGAPIKYEAYKDFIPAYACINVPKYDGYSVGSGTYAPQGDGTAVIIDAYVMGISIEIENIGDFLPAYEERIFNIYEYLYNVDYKDPSFVVKSGEVVQINGYEMYKFTAVHKYTYKEELCELECAGYATKLKSNGAIFYWLVVDEKGVGNLDDLLVSHADNMAKTLNDETV